MPSHGRNRQLPFLLVKFVDQAWVDEFVKGHLRLGTVAHYQQNYEAEPGGPSAAKRQRYRHDGLATDGQRTNGARYTKLYANYAHRTYVLCMVAITAHWVSTYGGFSACGDLSRLGNRAVIVLGLEAFYRRIDAALNRLPDFGFAPNDLAQDPGDVELCRVVDYVDLRSHAGPVDTFVKSSVFAYQNEWRLAITDRADLRSYPEFVYLDIGDLSDIVMVAEPGELDMLQFQLQEVAGELPQLYIVPKQS